MGMPDGRAPSDARQILVMGTVFTVVQAAVLWWQLTRDLTVGRPPAWFAAVLLVVGFGALAGWCAMVTWAVLTARSGSPVGSRPVAGAGILGAITLAGAALVAVASGASPDWRGGQTLIALLQAGLAFILLLVAALAHSQPSPTAGPEQA